MSISVNSVEEAIKIATGQANKEAPHLVVPFYMPLQKSIALNDALAICDDDIQIAVRDGKARLLAIATGLMSDSESSWSVTFVLLQGNLDDESGPRHFVYDKEFGECDSAVLMDGDGLRVSSADLSQEQAVAYWMGGFLGWNENCPGMYRLKYAMVEA